MTSRARGKSRIGAGPLHAAASHGIPMRFSGLHRFFDGIERLNAGPLQLAGVLVSVLFVRIVLEWALEAQKAIEPPASLVLFVAYFASSLAGLFLILWWTSGKPSLSVAKVLAVFSPILWIPPIWDLVASGGRGFTLQFVFAPPPYASALLNACADCAGVSSGLRVEVLVAAVASLAFVVWATGRWIRGLLAAAAVYAFVVFQALWPAYLMASLGHPYPDVFFMRELLSSYALLVCAMVVTAWHASGTALAQRIRLERVLHYVALSVFGAAIGFPHWAHAGPGVLLPLAALAVSIALAFLAAVWVNDWSDRRIDAWGTRRTGTSASFPLGTVIGLVLLSTLAALAAGYAAWVWVAFAFALSIAYSVPPLRLRRHVVSASLVLAACALAVVAAGFGVGLTSPETVPTTLPPAVALVVLGFVFLAAPFKDLKDAAGDHNDGVVTLATWLGPQTARTVAAGLVFSAVVWATILSGFLLPLGLLFGAVAGGVILLVKDWTRMERVVFALDYVFLAALALHLSGLYVLA